MDWMLYGKTFLVGGLLCALGQLGLSLTRLTTARILVVYVTAGVVLGGLGLYGCAGHIQAPGGIRRGRGHGAPDGLWIRA